MNNCNDLMESPVICKMAEMVLRQKNTRKVWLDSYGNDFWEHDLNYLMDTLAEGAQFVWALREAGSWLSRIDVHTKESECIEASLDSMTSDLFHITIGQNYTATIRPVAAEKVRALLLAKNNWQVFRSRRDRHTGSVDLKIVQNDAIKITGQLAVEYIQCRPVVNINFATQEILSRRLLADMKIIGRCESIKATGTGTGTGTLFTSAGKILVNGNLLDELLGQAA